MYILHAGIRSVNFLMNVNSKSSDTIPSSKALKKPTNAHRTIKRPEWKDGKCVPQRTLLLLFLEFVSQNLEFFRY